MKVEKNNLNRKIYALKDFRGVDYASSPLEVKPYRATDMANLLLENGMLHRRKGFRQVYKMIEDAEYFSVYVHKTNDPSYFVIQESYGDMLDLEYQDSMFHVVNTWYGERFETKEKYYVASRKENQSILVGDDLYFYGDVSDSPGILRYDGKSHKIVGVNEFYTPTTTINVPINARILDEENAWRSDAGIAYPYTSNESVNLLTQRVKNRLLFKEGWFDDNNIASNTLPFYRLDGMVAGVKVTNVAYPYTEVKDSTKYENNTPVLYVPNKNGGYDEYGEFVRGEIDSFVDTNPTAFFGNCWYNAEAGVVVLYSGDQVGTASYSLDIRNNSVLGVLKKSKFNAMIGSIESYVNGTKYKEFILEYRNAKLEDNSADITSCTCATLFGVDGANDRIFVGGGQKGNMVYFSENDISLKPNPTYFPADQFLVCGMDGAKVNGFMRVSNGTLAIFKDVENYEDVSVYYTSGHYVDVGTGEEGNTYQQARFTVQAGDIARKGISARAIDNYDGDNLFVSKEGVYGIQLSDNVASGERYARERSRTINPKITKHDLRNAKSIVYKDKYYLAVDNGEVYVADARYKFTQKGDQANTYNYEWFRLTGLYVKAWCIIYDKLCFIDKDGYLCKFTDEYADQYMVTSDDNELTVNTESVTFSSKYLELVKSSSYAIDQNGRTWNLELDEDETSIKIPEDIEIAEKSALTLWFYVPIPAYWQSAVLNLENPMYRKNMWGLSTTVAATDGGMINIGYKTRLNAVNNIEIEGANAEDYVDISFLGGVQTSMISGKEKAFGMYSFDVGGHVGINTYRRRVFERDFVHIQLLFTSESISDCVVNELDIEYAISKKNIGVG